MLLDKAHEWLGWPQPSQIFSPTGAGARVYADFAKRKIENSLKRQYPQLSVEAGVLATNPSAADTAAPLAVICQFPNGAPSEALDEAHRLAWSFSRTALLVTLEPHRLIAWSCCVDPSQNAEQRRVCELPTPEDFRPTGTLEQRSVRDLLHWVSLITGHYQRQYPERFRSSGRADELLLKNLRHVRRELIEVMALPRDFCHDLLARIIFTQFLFHRCDSDGKAFFSPTLLDRLRGTVLRERHESLESILRDKNEAFSLFRWLDDRFNGDLFPGKADSSDEERERAWEAEKQAVRQEHLLKLADLVSGKISTSDRQLQLWPRYSFDVVPLEFISSVYEEFLNEDKYKNKAFYTPPHLVDYLLDAVLPWEGEDWNLRILDPSCGSGIFLVKAFQRLIYRWRAANGREPLVSDLKPILANNLVGVDINPEAIRVASFSLYLAMADAIEPKHYVTREKVFPPLRGKQLIAADFFNEAISGFRTNEDAKSFHLIVGNAPWGESSIKKTSEAVNEGPTHAELWAKAHKWPVVNKDIGPLFLAKGLELVRDEGQVAMVQPALLWLYHRGGRALRLRTRFFDRHRVDEVTNLTAVRHELFPNVIGPSCIFVVGSGRSSPETTLFYFAPKPAKTASVTKSITIEPQDVSQIATAEAGSDPLIWSVLALGGRRDWNIVRKLRKLPTLAKLEMRREVLARGGVIPGNQKKEVLEARDKRYFEAEDFPDHTFLEFDSRFAQVRKSLFVDQGHGIKDLDAFKNPQLLVKHSFSAETNRFRAAMVRSDDPEWGVICKKTYLSVRDLTPDAAHFRAACLAYNSRLAVYYLAVTSSRFPLYNNEVPAKELRTVPLPRVSVDLSSIDSFEAIDELARELYELTQADWAVMEDLLDFTLPDCLRQSPGPGRNPTNRTGGEPEMTAYVQTLSRVLTGTFGKDKEVSATVYHEPRDNYLPVRMVTMHFNWPGRRPVSIEPIAADGLLDQLAKFARETLKGKSAAANGDSLGFQRVAYLFHSVSTNRGRVRSLTIVKPDERRYWTRSLAMRDADDLASAIFKAAGWKGGSG